MSQNNEKLGAEVLSVDQEESLLKPITDHVGKIQAQIDELRKDGTDKTVELLNVIQMTKNDKSLSKSEKENRIAEAKKALEAAQQGEKANKPAVDKLINEGVTYLNQHFEKEYYSKVVASCAAEKTLAAKRYSDLLAELRMFMHRIFLRLLVMTLMQNKKSKMKTMYIKTKSLMQN